MALQVDSAREGAVAGGTLPLARLLGRRHGQVEFGVGFQLLQALEHLAAHVAPELVVNLFVGPHLPGIVRDEVAVSASEGFLGQLRLADFLFRYAFLILILFFTLMMTRG